GRSGPHANITLIMTVDYAGVDAAANGLNLSTQISGSVVERPLSSGRTKVHVTLRTTNALAYVLDFTNFVFGNVLFGAPPSQVRAGANANLANSLLELVYITPRAPGGPVEDLVQVAFLPDPGQELVSASFFASSSGELRAAFGVPD